MWHTDPCTPRQLWSLSSLRSDPRIIIKPADKGGAVTVMDTHDYEAEALRQLNDQSNYAPVTERTEAWVTDIIEDMHDKSELDRTTYLYLRDRAELRTPQNTNRTTRADLYCPATMVPRREFPNIWTISYGL